MMGLNMAHAQENGEVWFEQANAAYNSGEYNTAVSLYEKILAADEIIVLKDGQIVEQGKHSDLVALGGVYTELYNTQFAIKNQPEGTD